MKSELCAVALIAACAPAPAPLAPMPDLSPSPALPVPADTLELPGLAPRALHPDQPLDELDVVTLAVLDNPGLKAERLRIGVADAQLVAAGLLPDPELDTTVARSALHTGYAISLTEPLAPLWTRGAAQDAARAHGEQVHLEVLWDEWQVAERASELFSQASADDQLAPVLTSLQALLDQRYQQAQAALAKGTVSMSTLAPQLVALADIEARVRQLELDANHTRHELDALLGVAPGTQLRLRADPAAPIMPRDTFDAAIAALASRRPDLLALQQGYRSEQAQLRAALLGRFPPVTVGVEQERGVEEGVSSFGVVVNVRLPLFDRNRGPVEIGRATRTQLREEYQARLDQAVNKADEVWNATQILSRELAALQARLPPLQTAASAARRSFESGTLDIDSYTAIASYALTEQAAAIQLEASLRAAQASLRILLGLPFAQPGP